MGSYTQTQTQTKPVECSEVFRNHPRAQVRKHSSLNKNKQKKIRQVSDWKVSCFLQFKNFTCELNCCNRKEKQLTQRQIRKLFRNAKQIINTPHKSHTHRCS